MATETGMKTGKFTSKYSDGNPLGQVMPFESICEPGAYVCNWSGHLLRVPEDATTAGRSPLINIVGPDNLFVTKISENPYVPVTKARLLASNYDIAVNF